MLNKYLTKDLKPGVSVLSRTNHKRLYNIAVELWFLTFSMLFPSHYYIKEWGSQHDGNKRALYSEKDMEMFIDIVLLHLSLMVNFKDKITAFVLMKTIFIALVLKQIILFSFEMCNDIDEKTDTSMVTVKPTDNNDFF